MVDSTSCTLSGTDRVERIHSALVRPQPLLCVGDVEASSRFYQRLLGARSDPGGPEYERLLSPAGELILQLHSFAVDHHHGPIGDATDRPYGNGVLLWFEIEDFDAAVSRVDELGVNIVLPPHRNPPEGGGGPNHREVWLRDLDGYTVVLASPDGEAGPP
jgi:catechol 2,3-dioxygenase-like lactoylglutathione lyase family enzyme